MKRFTILSLIALFVFSIGACTLVNTPSSAAKKMAGYLKNKDYQSFVDCISIDNSNSTPEMVAQKKEYLVTMMKEKVGKSIDEKGGIKSYEVLDEKINQDGQRATVKLKYTYGDGSTNEQDTNLIKDNGQWKIVLNK
jgi:hypothetical protein